MSAKAGANEDPVQAHDTDKTGGCVNCSRPDSYDDFVQCDQCDSWWHMKCASVSGSVAERSWFCRNCLPVSVHSKSSNRSARISLQLRRLEEERAIHKREMAAEKKAIEQEKKSIEKEKALIQQKYALLEEQLEEDGESTNSRSRTSRRTNQQRVKQWVEQQTLATATVSKPETEQLQLQRTERSPDRSIQRRTQPQHKGAIPKTIPKPQVVSCEIKSTGNPPILPAPSVQPPGKLPTISVTNQDHAQATEYSELLAKLGSISPIVNNANPTRVIGSVPVLQGHPTLSASYPALPGGNDNEPAVKANDNVPSNVIPPALVLSNVPVSIPSPSQLAARQIMPRDLPPFAGNPADWPIFISAFVNSTAACGYSSVENLSRLQRCLKGAAYEAVRSRLLLPESVPQVINTLQLLYGRPELLISVLLDKVRSTPAPKAERLETLIEFGLAVQSLCDHLEAAGQQPHLNNPCLLMELVDKLPAHVKMEWANFMQRYTVVNLKTFGEFMNGVIVCASKVTSYIGGAVKGASVEKSRTKSKGTINTHNGEVDQYENERKQCCVCKRYGHRVRDCDSFKALSIDSRWRTAQSNELCRSCLNAHGRRSCRNAIQCGINGCTFRHHPLLHSDRNNQPPPKTNLDVEIASNHTHRQIQQSLLFRIIPITLHGRNSTVTTYAFLDDGSSLTLIEEELANDIGVSGSVAPLCLTWTGNVTRMEPDSQRLDVSVSGVEGGKTLRLKDVRTVKKLSLPEQTLRFNELERKYTHLKGLQIASYERKSPRILIGINNLRLMLPLKIKEGRINEPVAMKTRLGWCIYGGSSAAPPHTLNFHACECDRTLHELVKTFFAVEDVGAKQKVELLSMEDKRALRLLEQTTKRVGDRYITGLLWRFDEIEFPDSYGMALRRLECLEKRMARNPPLKMNIHHQIKEYQLKGYMHQISLEEIQSANPKRVWYLPLGAVVNPKKPEKVRLIWDAAASVDGISLNSLLLKGPDQLTSLPAVLCRFRQYAVAISADIKEMFHQILISEEDRQSLRFLFRKHPEDSPEVYVMDVATFGATCSPASAQFVKNKNATEFAKKHPRAVEGIVANHYVDDYLDSFATEAEAIEIAEQVRAIHSKGGFMLRHWQSNCVCLKQRLGETTEYDNTRLLLDKSIEYGRVLGLLWLTDKDALSFCARPNEELDQYEYDGSRPTKRQVLRYLMGFFDPLGLLSCLTVHGKILLQDIWRAGIQWDEAISEEDWARWRIWTTALQRISNIEIARCYFPNANMQSYQQLQVHVFVDASEAAYAAVVYFRITDVKGKVKCALVTAKTKVAPLKPVTIPRMELQAAVLGTRLLRFVLESHTVNIKQRYLWSDSSTVLAWLRADPRCYKQYVACRIGEIVEQTEVNEWRWVPSKQNPADMATKWSSGFSMGISNAWFQGPSFLQRPEEEWPKQRTQRATDEELRVCHVHVEMATPQVIIDFNRFSRWERLHRAVANVHRYINNLASKSRTETGSTGHLTQDELVQAETFLLRIVQWQSYQEELIIMFNNRDNANVPPKGLSKQSILYSLTPCLDENGVLRLDGRIGAARNISYETKFPVILPRDH